MATLTGSRADLWVVHFQVDDRFLGVWDQFSGGETDSEETKYRPGGFDEELSLGGRQNIGNVTIARYFDEWVASIYTWLRSRAGKARAFVARYPYTSDYVQVGPSQGFQGTFKRLSLPDHDSMGTDVALVECEVTVDRAW